MARKTTGNGGPGRTKKTAPVAQAGPVPVAQDTKNNVVPINLEDEIRRRAYELYIARGSAPGNQQEDWIAAEREVLGRYQQQQHSA